MPLVPVGGGLARRVIWRLRPWLNAAPASQAAEIRERSAIAHRLLRVEAASVRERSGRRSDSIFYNARHDCGRILHDNIVARAAAGVAGTAGVARRRRQ